MEKSMPPRYQDLKPFGLGDFVSLVTNIEISNWGNTLTIYCLYNPNFFTPYRLVFENCSEIKLNCFGPDFIDDDMFSMVIIYLNNEIKPISSNERRQKLANIGTTVFEVSVQYETLTVHKE